MSSRPDDEGNDQEPTREELEAGWQEAKALHQKIFSNCKRQNRCQEPWSFTWRFKVLDKLKPTKCNGVCLCEAHQRQPVTFACDFTKDKTITIS